MCGIVGIAGKFNKKKDIMKFLLTVDATRGVDGAGIAGFDYDDKCSLNEKYLFKTVGHCFNLLESREFTKFVDDCDVMLGHNRATSVGKSNYEGCHPHKFDNIVGVHNGTLSLFYESNYPGCNSYQTDSQWIFATINKSNIVNTVKHMSGSYALVWVNKQKGTINFLRNKERPLWIMESDEGIMWASENWMLASAMAKFDIKGEIHPLVEDTLIIYKKHMKKGTINKIHISRLEGKKEVKKPDYKNYYHPYYGGFKTGGFKTTVKQIEEKQEEKEILHCFYCKGPIYKKEDIDFKFKDGEQVKYACKYCAEDSSFYMN